jgi:hypothetical protein
MQIKSFGCSFIYGTDLPDDKKASRPRPSTMTWPALLAQRLKLDYACYAQGGQGNTFVLDQILCEAAKPTRDLFVIGWTWIDRFDYVNKQELDWVDWKAIRPTTDDAVSATYYRHLHSQYRDKLSSLVCMQSAIDTLQRKNIPFIMTSIDDILFERQWNVALSIGDLQDYVEPYVTRFDGTNFLDWSRQQGFPISDSWHPLAQAHQAAADVMMPRAQSLV